MFTTFVLRKWFNSNYGNSNVYGETIQIRYYSEHIILTCKVSARFTGSTLVLWYTNCRYTTVVIWYTNCRYSDGRFSFTLWHESLHVLSLSLMVRKPKLLNRSLLLKDIWMICLIKLNHRHMKEVILFFCCCFFMCESHFFVARVIRYFFYWAFYAVFLMLFDICIDL